MLTVNIESEFDSPLLKRSIAHLETAVRSDAQNSRYRKILSEAYLAARRFQDAADQLEIVWRQRPEPRVAYLMAFSLFRLGRLEEAEDFIERAKSDGDQPIGFARMHVLKGRIAMERAEYAEAVNEFSKAMILNPSATNPKWHMGRALVRFATGAREDGAPLFRRALNLLKDLEVKPQQENEWHENLGRIYLALHHPVEALRHFERSENPATSESAMLMGFAYLLQGQHKSATPYLQRAAADPETRPQCCSYLQEVAMIPRHQLSNMGLETGKGGIPLFLDHEFLGSVFGPDSDEVGILINAGINPHGDLADRTQAEVRPEARTHGRLLAPGEESNQKKETSPGFSHDLDLEPTKAHASPEKNREATARTSGDKLFPQTLLEINELDATTELQPVQVENSQVPPPDETLSDDDWDIGLDEAFEIEPTEPKIPHTTQDEIQDTSKLDLNEEEDDDKDDLP